MIASQIDMCVLRDLITDRKSGIESYNKRLDIRLQGCHVDNSKNKLWVNLSYFCIYRCKWVDDDTSVDFDEYIRYKREDKLNQIL